MKKITLLFIACLAYINLVSDMGSWEPLVSASLLYNHLINTYCKWLIKAPLNCCCLEVFTNLCESWLRWLQMKVIFLCIYIKKSVKRWIQFGAIVLGHRKKINGLIDVIVTENRLIVCSKIDEIKQWHATGYCIYSHQSTQILNTILM
jgi:hypothetical protein